MGNEERRRPPVPQIPGLAKGKIEAQRELWASRRRVGFSESRADVFIIDGKIESYLSLPVLGNPASEPKAGEATTQPFWLPRVEPLTGAIYFSKWDKPQELDPERFVAFGGKKYVKGMKINDVPKSWTSAWLIPQRYETIEDAIEAAQKIASYEGVGGPAQTRVENLFATLNSISDIFLNEEVTQLRLEGMAKQVESLLKQHGLLTAKDSIWRKVFSYTLRATSTDALGRVNPMVSRILARAAYLKVVHRESKQRAAREKALRLVFYLTDTLVEAISGLETTEMVLDNLGGFAYCRPTPALSGETRWMDPREASPIERAIKVLVKRSLAPIEAAPYVYPARLAEAILIGKIGKSNKQVETLKGFLKAEDRREIDRRSAVDYLMGLDAFSAKKRMHQAFAAAHRGLTPSKVE